MPEPATFATPLSAICRDLNLSMPPVTPEMASLAAARPAVDPTNLLTASASVDSPLDELARDSTLLVAPSKSPTSPEMGPLTAEQKTSMPPAPSTSPLIASAAPLTPSARSSGHVTVKVCPASSATRSMTLPTASAAGSSEPRTARMSTSAL